MIFFFLTCRKERDRKRQEQLAKERLEQRRKQRAVGAESKQNATPVQLPENENDKPALQEAVVKEMEIRHSAEREFLMEVRRGYLCRLDNYSPTSVIRPHPDQHLFG